VHAFNRMNAYVETHLFNAVGEHMWTLLW
jgi:hypothetical protein